MWRCPWSHENRYNLRQFTQSTGNFILHLRAIKFTFFTSALFTTRVIRVANGGIRARTQCALLTLYSHALRGTYISFRRQPAARAASCSDWRVVRRVSYRVCARKEIRVSRIRFSRKAHERERTRFSFFIRSYALFNMRVLRVRITPFGLSSTAEKYRFSVRRETFTR